MDEGNTRMREVIANTEYYEMEVDREKNRSYSIYRGYWESVDAVPDYLDDVSRVCKRLKPGFTTIIDLREMKIPHPEVMKLLIKAQEIGEKSGFSRCARIVLTPLEKLATKRIVSEASEKEKSREFNTVEEAEKWLDE